MNLRPIILALSLSSLAATAFAADTNKFDLLDAKDAKTGTAAFSIEKTKDSIKVRSTITYTLSSLGSRNIEYRIAGDGKFLSGSSLKPDETALTSYTPSKAHDSLEISYSRPNVPNTDRKLAISDPGFVVLFPDDPSVWQVLLDADAARPHSDKLYLILIPSANNWTPDKIEHAHLAAPRESTGTLAGKAVKLQHFVFTFSNGIADLYTDSNGVLMRADCPRLSVKTVRAGFVLDK